MSEVQDALNERKNQPIDQYGLSADSVEDAEQPTPYDAFILEDCLRFISIQGELKQIKESMQSRMDPTTGLYVVTKGDINKEYYRIATMFNRLSNKDYSKKVYRSVRLLQAVLRNVRRDYIETIKGEVAQQDFNNVMQRETERLHRRYP